MNETEAMNRLQANGVVSDECVTAKDVAAADCPRAIRWLEKNLP